MTCPQHPMGCRCAAAPRPAPAAAPSVMVRCRECGDHVVYVSTDGLCDGCVEEAAIAAEADDAATAAALAEQSRPLAEPPLVVMETAPEPIVCPRSGLRGYVHRLTHWRSS